LGTGSAAIITGLIIDSSKGEGEESYTGGFLEVGGVVCMLTSIPFFMGSAKNKKRAVTLTLNHQKIAIPENGLAFKKQAVLSFHILLNTK
jgi:HD-like signal output (HDOD) protein